MSMSLSLLDLYSAISCKAFLLRWVQYRVKFLTCDESLRSWQSAHAVRQAVSSRPTDPQQRRPDGRFCVVDAAEQSDGAGWLNVDVGWRRRRPERSTRPSTFNYLEALFSRHRRTMTASLYSTRSGTLSQWSWSWSSVDSPRSYLRVQVARRAAALSTRCKVSVMYWGDPANIALQ